MMTRLIRIAAGALIIMITSAVSVQAQAPTAGQNEAPSQYTAAQLDQMLAPIALYPDPLVSQILMASTYPLEIVEADRWLQDPNNAALRGDELAAAVEQQSWDPSVKSLAPFPQILAMLDGNLDWTENLGDAFLANQNAVMDEVQRLRQRASAAGTLKSSAQEKVLLDGSDISIEPPNADDVYVPVYDPTDVYGMWPYPDYPPFYFPGFFGDVFISSFGFKWWHGGIVAPLWGWNRWNWRQHRIDIDRNRFAALNNNRPPVANIWEHDPMHRRGVPYRNPTLAARFGTANVNRGFRGYSAGNISSPHSTVNRGRSQSFAPRVPPEFESFGRGSDVGADAARGHASRIAGPSFGRSTTAFGHAAPSGGGRGPR